jgi:flagellar biogenesis protein FliO
MKDNELLQREQKEAVSQALVVSGYLAALLVALGLYGSLAWGLRMLQQRLGTTRTYAQTGRD